MLRTPLLSSLRARLVLLVLIAAVPLFVLTLLGAIDERNRAYQQVRETNLSYLRLAELNLGQLVGNTRSVLTTLSRMPQIADKDEAGCVQLLQQVLQSSDGYRAFSVSDPNGDVWCIAPPLTYTLNISHYEFFQRVIGEKTFVVGEYVVGSRTGRGSLALAYPLLDIGGNVVSVVSAGVDADWFNQSFDDLRLPDGYVVNVLDHDGTFVVRWPDPEDYVGTTPSDKPIIQRVLNESRGGHEVIAEMEDIEGTWRLYASSSVPGAGNDLFVYIGVSPEIAYAGINNILLRDLVGFGLISLVALAVAWYLGDALIVRRALRVINTSKRLQAGDLSARTSLMHDDSELGQLTRAFDAMAASLQQHEQERNEATDKLRASEEEQRTLAEVSAAGNMSLDYSQSLHDIAHTIVTRFADICVIGIIHNDGVIRQSVCAHKDTDRQAALDEVVRCCFPSFDLNSKSEFAERLRNGELTIYPAMGLTILESGLTDARQIELLTSLQLGPTIVLPLMERSRILGVLTLIRYQGSNTFGKADMDLARRIASRVSQTLDSARLYQEVQQSNAELEQRVATRTAQLQTSNAKLLQFQSALRDLSRYQNTRVEEERARIAREVHDQLGQALTSIKMDLSAAQRQLARGQIPALDKIKSAMRLVDETIQLARRISSDLRPGVLDNLGLEAAVDWQLREFEKRSGVHCELSAAVDEATLTRETSTATFRILQEALTNVARHAKASQVRVTLETSSDKLILLVQDNGVGITEERQHNSKSLGVLGMRERAAALGGVVELNGAPNRGTRMTMTLPLGKNGLNHDGGEKHDQGAHR